MHKYLIEMITLIDKNYVLNNHNIGHHHHHNNILKKIHDLCHISHVGHCFINNLLFLM